MRFRVKLSMLCLFLISLNLTGTAVGASQKNLSEDTYQRLARVHDLMQREDYAQALSNLDALYSNVRRDKYEAAMLLQTYAYLYAKTERSDLALKAIHDCFAMNALPRQVVHNLYYLSAQIRIGQDDYSGALADLTEWFGGQGVPSEEAYSLAGLIYAKLGDTSAAIENLELAVKASPEPQEASRRQLLASYLEARRLLDAAKQLKQIIVDYGGKPEDWRLLSSIYRELGDDRMALAVLVLAMQRGLVQSEADLLLLVNYYLHLDLPYEAATLLERSLQDNLLSSSADNWELLADAWSRSRESTKAIQSLNQAALLMNDPELHLKRARIAATVADWGQVLQAVEDALRNDTLSSFGEAYLLEGIAYHHRDEIDSAHAAFVRAEQDATTRDQARRWLDFLEQKNR